jgi:hypothetical protein
MPTKQTTQARAVVPAGADDLARIRGIGPGIQQRLYAAGIVTFEQLAGRSAAELAAVVGDIAGMSAELISKKDWVGQAQALAEAKAAEAAPEAVLAEDLPADLSVEAPAALARQHYATFTVELLLGDEREVRRTRVRHVQGGAEEAWASWNAPRLLDFFIGQAALEVAESAPEPAAPETAAAEARPVPQPTLAVRSLEVVPADGEPGNFLAHGQSFEVRLGLDIEEEAALRNQPLSYALVVNAKDLRTRSHHTIGETQGALTPGDPSLLRVPGAELPRGIFRLETAVTIELPPAEGKAPERLTAFQEGQLFQVY